jgi:glucose-1-phosphate thymidylyltransferase
VCGGVEIQSSEIEHSIVMANSRILEAGLRIEDSLIGKGVVIRHAERMPRALRFMLGDHSEVQLV